MAATPETLATMQSRLRIDRDLAVWIVVGVLSVIGFWLSRDREFRWLLKYPRDMKLAVADWVNAFMHWFIGLEFTLGSLTLGTKPFFRLISEIVSWPMGWIQDFLQWLPWPATMALFVVFAYVSRGIGLAVFTAIALLYMVIIGYWPESMNTLALVFMSIPLAVGTGLLIGIWAYKSPAVNRVAQPVLDLMQTVPTFAYLIPILLLFGFGPVVGLIASAIYACPPMVRNVILGLQRVPLEVIESGLMSGATRRQLLWRVEVPTAMPTIMIGVNQSVMAALSMVIIAAIIGSSADIGWEVLSTMRKAAFGESLLAGIVIALIAMMFDRISRGFSDRNRVYVASESWLQRYRYPVIAIASALVLTLLAQLVPALQDYPSDWSPARWLSVRLNGAVDWVTGNHHETLDAWKNTFLFYFLLPLRVGLETSIRPHTWGFELTPALITAYAVLIASLAALAARISGWRAVVVVILLGALFYFGVSKVPWPVFTLIITVIAWQVGGWRVATLACLGLLFIATTGVWGYAMRSVYLCAAAVLTSFIIGSLLGMWAAHNDRVSGFIRPINDTLQTMPLFVLLIPVLMFFQIGEFTAYLAIIMYAIVPAVRYTEHGLRQVPRDMIEAAESMGCTRAQVLWQVKLPLAIPEIMLGLNQTIMFGLAMLVIAALVGTKGLGQQVYVALNAGDTGKGVVAGLGIALIAMITDRIIQAWSKRQKAALGLA